MADEKLKKSDIRAAASDLNVEGRGKMDTPELAAAIVTELNPVAATGEPADAADLPDQPDAGMLPRR